MIKKNSYDVIVIGGGHAGIEATHAAAQLGLSSLLLTQQIDKIGHLSCNPAIGGIGKGHLVKELDALGGLMPRLADYATIQIRRLNRSKGPAVQATRVQVDRDLYMSAARHALFSQPRIQVVEGEAVRLLLSDREVTGIQLACGFRIYSRSVVLTVGTFLSGQIYIGRHKYAAGRAGDSASTDLGDQLKTLGFSSARLKTGTPPRLLGKSIDYSRLKKQEGDTDVWGFSVDPTVNYTPNRVACAITYTTERTHDIIRKHLHESPLYSGEITGTGPRYCPSIEDKVVKFAERSQHQIFLEPEKLDQFEIYPNGLSTSLPYAVQLEWLRTIPGLESVEITRPGYAIEYDFFEPTGLTINLESQHIPNLFLAGQINGTTGYEEAAVQGAIAGINAALKQKEKDFWVPSRAQAYIGVLLDDLVQRGTTEPYRMFTSRAEFRLLLREDNADLRLTPKAYELGLVNEERWKRVQAREAILAQLKESFSQQIVSCALRDNQADLTSPMKASVAHLLKRPEISLSQLIASQVIKLEHNIELRTLQTLEADIKYAGYLEAQRSMALKMLQEDARHLPKGIDYQSIPGLSREAVARLTAKRPSSIGQAARMEGITPAAIAILLVWLKRHAA